MLGLSEDVEELEERVSTLESDKRELQNKVKEYAKKIEELEADNEKLSQQLKQSTGNELSSFKLTVSARATEKIDKLKAKVTTLNEIVKQQEDKLAEVTKKANKPPKESNVLKLSFDNIKDGKLCNDNI